MVRRKDELLRIPCPTKGERLMGKGGFKNKELRVWQNGKDLAVYVYQIE